MASGTISAAEVLDMERERFAHMLAGRADALEALFDPGLVYTHSTGQVDDRERYLALLRTGILKYRTLVPSEQVVTLLGDVALIDGKLLVEGAMHDVVRKFESRFLSIWVLRPDGWRHLRWHATGLPQATDQAETSDEDRCGCVRR